MEFRKATRDDAGDIRRVARESLLASYVPPLDDELVEDATEQWYGDEAFATELDGEDALLYLVAVDDGEVVAFSQSAVEPEERTVGSIQWLHVAPEYRNRGVGADLLEHTEVALFDAGVTYLEGRVLTDNAEGNEFYRDNGFHPTGERSVDIGGETFSENAYVKLPDDDAADDLLEEWTTPDGTVVYVAFDERERGSEAPFYAVYRTADRERRYGYLCGNCESFDVAAGSMDQLECNNCGNTHQASRWDAAYL